MAARLVLQEMVETQEMAAMAAMVAMVEWAEMQIMQQTPEIVQGVLELTTFEYMAHLLTV
jgi:hypothetical protein